MTSMGLEWWPHPQTGSSKVQRMIFAAAQRVCQILSDSLGPRVSIKQYIIYGTVTALVVATCLYYKSARVPAAKNLASPSLTFQSARATSKSSKSQSRHQNKRLPVDGSFPPGPSMPYPRRTRQFGKPLNLAPDPIQPQAEKSKQPCEAFLVLDVEATCQEGTDFNFPNEIIVRMKGLTMYYAYPALSAPRNSPSA